jgi:hypothetical protein
MHKFILWCALILGVTAVYAADAPPPEAKPVPLALFNFDRDPLGKTPERFTLIIGGEGQGVHWEVRQEREAPSPPNVLAQTGRTQPGENFALALLDGVHLQHGEVAVKFKAIGGAENQAAGLVWRYRDPKNFYVAMASVKGDVITAYRVRKGKRKILSAQDVIVAPMRWHELRLVFINNSFSVFMDGELVLGAKDSSLLDAGRVGLGTQSDSEVLFDDFRVTQ